MSDYDTDFDAWLAHQVAALRAKDWAALDVEHLAEEVEDVRKSDRRAVRSHWRLLWLHLLKWAYQPGGRARYGGSWEASVLYTRGFIAAALDDSPSLTPMLLETLAAEAYPWARARAARETGLPLSTFPAEPPWSPAQALDDAFWPEPDATP
jgi:hypothetical protein